MGRLSLVCSAVCLALCLGCLTGCGVVSVEQTPDPSAVPHTSWERLPDPPLGRRLNPVVAWTGREVLVLGGDPGAPCPVGADCVRANPYQADGAAYDPSSRTWRPIASAPVGVPDLAPHAYVAGHLFVLTRTRFLDYDVAADRWRQLPALPGMGWYTPVVDGGRLVLCSTSDEQGARPDYVYDVDTGRRTRLPIDPIGPAFDRSIAATPRGLVLTARKLAPNPGADGPAVLLGAVLSRRTGEWRRLPDSDQLGGGAWSWTGHRLVDPTLGGADGGKVGNYGRTVPYGGTLDPATGRWEPLPHPPDESDRGWAVEAGGGSVLAAGGWFYDDGDQSWRRVPRPKDGPAQPGPAVWAGGRLIVVGGLQQQTVSSGRAQLSPQMWGMAGRALQ